MAGSNSGLGCAQNVSPVAVNSLLNPLCTDCTTFDPLESKLFKISIDRNSVITGLLPKLKYVRRRENSQLSIKHHQS